VIASVRHVLTARDRSDKLLRELGAAHVQAQRQAERAEEQARQLTTLLSISRSVASTLETEPLVGAILDQLKLVVEYSAASVRLLDGDQLVMLAYRGPNPRSWRRARMAVEFNPLNHEVVRRRAPLLVADAHTDPSEPSRRYREAIEWKDPVHAHVRSWLGLPLLIREEVIGLIVLNHRQPTFYTPQHAALAQAFAQHAAVAIENARLYAQAQRAAALEERQRLARELHDAVTQTLFSASLIADVLPRLFERDPEEAHRRLEELRQLTRGALAEMRALLLELRPAALTEAPLPELLRHLTEAASGRARIPVALELEGEATGEPLPAEAQVALYRIAQEALHNVVKHAGARRVKVGLRAGGELVGLHVEDDGAGFDPATVSAEHLGLRIMGERAAAIGTALRIDSAPGRGARVSVIWRRAAAARQTSG
jgi:two-component system nitrate/nitrite sensor histidine kinase NarX